MKKLFVLFNLFAVFTSAYAQLDASLYGTTWQLDTTDGYLVGMRVHITDDTLLFNLNFDEIAVPYTATGNTVFMTETTCPDTGKYNIVVNSEQTIMYLLLQVDPCPRAQVLTNTRWKKLDLTIPTPTPYPTDWLGSKWVLSGIAYSFEMEVTDDSLIFQPYYGIGNPDPSASYYGGSNVYASYHIHNDTVYIIDPSCNYYGEGGYQEGKYFFIFNPTANDTLRMYALNDPCEGRAQALNLSVWVRKLNSGTPNTLAQEDIRLAPNPSINGKTMLYLPETPDNTAILRITDMSGKLILQQSIRSNQLSIDLSTQPQGVYLLNVQGGGLNKTIPFVR